MKRKGDEEGRAREARKGVEKEEEKRKEEKMRFAIGGERNETSVHHFKRA